MSGAYTSQCFVGSPVSILVDSGTASPDIKSFGHLLNVRGSDNVTDELHAFTDATCTTKSYHLNTYYDNVTVGSGAGGTHIVLIQSTSIRLLVSTTAAETWAEALFSLALTVGTEYKIASTLLYYNMRNVSSTTFYKGTGSTSAYPSAVDTAVSYTKL